MNAATLHQEIPSELLTEAIAWRHDLHAHPELAYTEHRTAEFVATQLAQYGLKVHRGLGGTGVVGTLTRGSSTRAIGIRADMDALKIQEQSGAAHASRSPGLMHACGHDGHTAIALAAARVCASLPDLDGTVHFIFQPAEEGLAGARRMIEDGLFRLFPCESVYGLHNWPELPLGTCVARDGAMMAANAVLDIEILGRGCHAAMPHQGRDPLLAGCQFVSAVQSVVSRNIDPLASAAVSLTQFHAGETHNVIPNHCLIRGTARWFDAAVGDTIEHRVGDLARSVAAGFGCEAQLRFDRRYPATINDPAAAKFVRDTVATMVPELSVIDVPPSMASEDFSFMLQQVPGCYLWLGSQTAPDSPGLHSPKYDFNDDLISRGISLWVAIVRQKLASR